MAVTAMVPESAAGKVNLPLASVFTLALEVPEMSVTSAPETTAPVPSRTVPSIWEVACGGPDALPETDKTANNKTVGSILAHRIHSPTFMEKLITGKNDRPLCLI